MNIRRIAVVSTIAALTGLGCAMPPEPVADVPSARDVPNRDVPNRDVPNFDVPNTPTDMPTGCAAGETMCNGMCVNTQSDGMNCGACGTMCPAGQSCQMGMCQPGMMMCPMGQTMCGANCADTQTDVMNCGACGTACGAGQVCQAGMCQMNMMMCPGAQMNCGGQCVDTTTSAANCGMCGRACAMGQTCAGGMCSGNIMCPPGQTMCGMACADFQTDALNCGGCGAACSMGQMCTAGRCVNPRPMCAAGETDCTPMAAAPTCVNTQTSSANCGACGTACIAGQTCVAGACRCAAGSTLCGRTCVNTQTDSMNCGGCNVVCSGGQTCTAGACRCPAGQMACNGVCVNTNSDNSHCGMCNNACAMGRTCAAGVCNCNAGTSSCVIGGVNTCVNLQTDRANCGMCGRACIAGQSCTAGACACPAGRLLCPPMGAMQACIDPQTDASNCGACGMVCPMGTACTAGRCMGVPPANDTRAGATLIDLAQPSQTLMANTTAARNDTRGSCSCTGGNDVFYRFVLTQPEIVYADTLGATADTSLFFQDSMGANITAAAMSGQVACNDDSGSSGLCGNPGGFQSMVVLRLAAGTYYLVLSGCSAGASSIHFQHLPAGGGTASPIDPTNVVRSAMGTTMGASATSTTCCSSGADSSLWWLTCPNTAAESFAISTCNAMTGVNAAAYDVSLSQYSALRPAAMVSVCRDDVLGATCGRGSAVTGSIPATGANQVGLNTSIVDGCNAAGAWSANFRRQACAAGTNLCQAGCVDLQTDERNCGSCDFRCAAGSLCFAGACVAPPANDRPANATVINMANPSSSFTVDMRSANNDTTGTCACTSGVDAFWNFTIPAGPEQLVYADTIGSPNDTGLFIQNSGGLPVVPALANGTTCNDDGGLAGCTTGRQSQVLARLPPGQYRLVLSGCGPGAAGERVNFQHLPIGSGTLNVLQAGASTPVGVTAGMMGALQAGTCTATGPENTYYWYTCPAQLAGTLTASTCGRATWDTVLSQSSATRAMLSVCSDDVGGACGQRSTVTAAIPAGAGIHTLYVDGFGTASGIYSVSVTRP